MNKQKEDHPLDPRQQGSSPISTSTGGDTRSTSNSCEREGSQRRDETSKKTYSSADPAKKKTSYNMAKLRSSLFQRWYPKMIAKYPELRKFKEGYVDTLPRRHPDVLAFKEMIGRCRRGQPTREVTKFRSGLIIKEWQQNKELVGWNAVVQCHGPEIADAALKCGAIPFIKHPFFPAFNWARKDPVARQPPIRYHMPTLEQDLERRYWPGRG